MAATNMGEKNYGPYKEKQKKLSEIIKRASDLLGILNMDSHQENLDKVSEKIENDSFKIQIVGTFKNGKSMSLFSGSSMSDTLSMALSRAFPKRHISI